MGSRLEDGHRAERLVARYLVADGWRIIARNVYFRRGELDIVAWERDELVFVEVRSRRSDALVRAVDTVTLKKRRRLLAAASAYLAQRGWYDVNARFDVIGVDSEAWKIVDHVRRAFTSELL